MAFGSHAWLLLGAVPSSRNRSQFVSVLVIALAFAGMAPAPAATVGASTPFISYQAEAGNLGGGATIVALTNCPTNQFSSPELEASGHAYVRLRGTGQYVEWTNNTGQAITALNLRSCIPDAPSGGGIASTLDLYVNGVLRQAFSVNSQQNYCYEGNHYNGQIDKNPADATRAAFGPHRPAPGGPNQRRWNSFKQQLGNGARLPGN